MIAKNSFSCAALAVTVLLSSACTSNASKGEVAPAALRVVQPPPPTQTQNDATGDGSPSNAPSVEFFGGPVGKSKGGSLKQERLSDGKRFELNLQDAEVRGVVDAILGDILKVNYTVAPQVQGRLTLRTGRPVARTSLLSVLETALLSVSAALVEEDGAYHVIPLDAAPQRIRSARRMDDSRRTSPGYAIEVVPLRYVSAKEMQKVLESFAPKGSVLQADEAHNHLVLAGTSQERASMTRTIDSFDVDWMDGAQFAIYHLDQIGAEQLVTELKQVFQPPLELMGSRIRLVPIERMQVVLGIAKNRADLELLDEWVRRLDVSPKSGGRKLYVYNVQNGNAKDLASSLQLVLTGEVSPTRGRSVPKGADQASGMGSVPVQGAPGADFTQQPAGNTSRVVSNDENNSLLMFSTEQEYRLVKDALSKLDILPRQVMIEAILAEVTLNDNLRYGVQWYFNNSANSFTLSGSDAGSVSSQFPGFSYVYSGLKDARIVINALQSTTDVKVLSAPKLSVLNNQKATLQVGDQVPIRTQLSQGTAVAGAPIITSIQMLDTGVILEVTPRVNDNGNVILDVTQEVSEVATTTSSGIDSPTIQRRRLHSVVATRDGATVALGGLMRENASRGNGGIPLLKDIPFLGGFFRTTTSDSRRTELIVLLVPHVMRNHEETEAVVDALIGSVNAAAEFASRAANIAPKTSP